MRFAFAILTILALTACKKDESISAFVAPDSVWTLTTLDGQVFAARATITFPSPGEIAGQAPCNSYSSSQSAPYPWFEIGPVAATKMACAEGQQERAFFAALSKAAFAEVSGDTLILSDEAGAEMLFTSN